WVRAKLALRRGDRAAAVRDWTAAFTATETTSAETTLDAESKIRLRGELAVMRLSQGEYRDSLQLLFPVAGTSSGAIIYIAERVLPLDEPKTFLDALPPAPETPQTQDDRAWDSSASPVTGLRGLLGRRLVRAGRTSEALAYFPAKLPGGATGEPDGNRAIVDDVRDYADAIASARPPSFESAAQKARRAEARRALP